MLPPADRVAEIIRRGNACRRLIADPDLIEVFNDLDTYHLSALVAAPTGPAGREARDHHHQQLASLRELLGELASRAQALDAYEEDQSGPSETEED